MSTNKKTQTHVVNPDFSISHPLYARQADCRSHFDHMLPLIHLSRGCPQQRAPYSYVNQMILKYSNI